MSQPTLGTSTIFKNTLWNLVGQGAPMLLSFISIPLLVKGLGIDQFGAFTLIIVMINYLGLLDLGISRAMIQLLAEKIGRGEHSELPSIMYCGLGILSLAGVLAAAALLPLSGWITTSILRIPEHFSQDMALSLRLLALVTSVTVLNLGLIAYLEAQQRFNIMNTVRGTVSIGIQAALIFVAIYSPKLSTVVAVLSLEKIILCILLGIYCYRDLKQYGQPSRARRYLPRLVHFGKWIAVSNAINPLITSVDRFVLNRFLSIEAVAFYSTPYELAAKLLTLSSTLASALFPAFSTMHAQGDKNQVYFLKHTTKILFLVMSVPMLSLYSFAPEVFQLWLGPQFAIHSTAPFRWLLIGMLVNSLAQIPFQLIQGVNKPSITAKFHIIELPIYFLALGFLCAHYGIRGAAIAWGLRVCLDYALLLTAVKWLLGNVVRISWRYIPSMTLFIGILSLPILPLSLLSKSISFIALAVGFLLLSYLRWFSDNERMQLCTFISRIKRTERGYVKK